jgi:predicted permease
VVRQRVLVPPVVGVLLGLLCSSLPPLYYLLCGGTYGERLPAGTACPASSAPLGFFARGISTLGDTAVPINLLLLGNALSKG